MDCRPPHGPRHATPRPSAPRPAGSLRMRGRRAAGGGQLWDLSTLQSVQQLRGHSGRVTACAVTPHPHVVASASLDASVRLWDLRTAGEAAALRGHAVRAGPPAPSPATFRVDSHSRPRPAPQPSLCVFDPSPNPSRPIRLLEVWNILFIFSMITHHQFFFSILGAHIGSHRKLFLRILIPL